MLLVLSILITVGCLLFWVGFVSLLVLLCLVVLCVFDVGFACCFLFIAYCDLVGLGLIAVVMFASDIVILDWFVVVYYCIYFWFG